MSKAFKKVSVESECYINTNKQNYDKMAKKYKERHKSYGVNEPKPEDYLKVILNSLTKTNNLKSLELGPGSGEILECFEKNGIETTAIEISEEMVKVAKEKSPSTEFINDNVLNVDFEDNSFDIIFAGSFIHLFQKDDLSMVMKKMYKWIDLNGVIFIYTTLHDEDDEGFFHKGDYEGKIVRYRHLFSEKSLKQLITDNNFEMLNYYQIKEPEREKIWQFCLFKKK